MKRAAWILGLALAVVLVIPQAQAAKYKVDSVHSSVGFNVRHFVSRVNGNFSKFSGTVVFNRKKPRRTKIKAVVHINSVNTNNAKRDGHLKSKDFFYTKKFPKMTFVSTKVTKVRRRGKKITMNIRGKLTIRGVTRRVTLKTTFLGQVNAGRMGVRAGFVAKATINRFRFKLSYGPRVMLGSDVNIILNVAAVKVK